MTKRNTITWIVVLFALGGLAFGLWAKPLMPAVVPSHWNAAGEADGFSPAGQAVWLMPAITLLLGLFLIYLPMIDPLHANVEKFRGTYHWAVAGFALFFTYIHVLTILAGLGVFESLNMTYALIPAFGLLFTGLGFMLEKTQPNWFIGIRTPWTLSSPVVWEKTHKVGGLLFKAAGVLILLGIFLPTQIAFALMVVPLLLAALGTIVYSYIVYRQVQAKK